MFMTPPDPIATLSFDLRNGHIVLAARVAGHDATLIVDTGSGLGSLDVTFAERIGVVPDEDSAIREVHGTGVTPTTLATVPHLRVGPLEYRDQKVLLLPLAAISRASGYQVDGILGWDFLNRYVVRIDFEARTMTLFDPATWSYEGEGTEVPVSLQYRIPVVDVPLVTPAGDELRPRLALDLGSAHIAVRLLGQYVDDHAAALSAIATEAPIGDGVGGRMHGRVGHLCEARVGALTLHEPTIGISSEVRGVSALSIFDGTLGAPFFNRTTMILDYARERILFEAHAGFDAPYSLPDKIAS
jgi:hypothetical protein